MVCLKRVQCSYIGMNYIVVGRFVLYVSNLNNIIIQGNGMCIVMWLGFRNFLIVMMYVFGVCVDCVVWDEFFYVLFLYIGGRFDFLLDIIFDKEEINFEYVVNCCVGEILDNKMLFYQKYMLQYMFEGFLLDWMDVVKYVFFICYFVWVIMSYIKKNGVLIFSDIGVKE